ncbi:MAG: hypothetical protein QXG01_02080 [Candidatus Bathyarchaeia archaeon]
MKDVIKMTADQAEQPKLFKKALFPALIYLVIGLFNLLYSISYDKSLIPVDVVSLLCIFAGLGIIFRNYWAFVLALIIFPPSLTIEVSTLSYSISIVGFDPNVQTLLFHVFLIILTIALIFSFLRLLTLRKGFKKSP